MGKQWLAAMAFFVLVLAGCGGGGSTDAPPAAQAAPVIRFEMFFDPAFTPPNGIPARYVGVRSAGFPGALGNNPTAKVEVTIAGEQPVALTAPSYVDTNGRATYLFRVSDSYQTTWYFHNCSPTLEARAVVTDSTGFSLARSISFCADGYPVSIGTFSDAP